MDRGVVFVGAIPVSEDWLMPQRAAMVGLGKLAEAIIGTSPLVDGLQVQPTTPTSLAVQVTPGQIYAQASLDPSPYGSMPADARMIVKQGINLDALRLPVTPPGTAGYSQTFLVQAAFQEQDGGAVVLPYYNSANPQQPFAGPGNSGEQQYTRRNGAIVVQLKASAPAPTVSQTRPEPDPGYTGLAWVTVASGQAVILAQHITSYTPSSRLPVKLPQMMRGVGLNYTVLTAGRQLLPDEAGTVVVNTSVIPWLAEVRLPPAGAVPGVPLRFRIMGRPLTPRTARVFGSARVVPSAGDTMDEAFALVSTNDTVEFVSDGLSRWFWVGGRWSASVIVQAAQAQVIPNNVVTAVAFQSPGDLYLSSVWSSASPTRLRIPTDGRVRLQGNVGFGTNPNGTRSARLAYNGGNPLQGLPVSTNVGQTGTSGFLGGVSLAGGSVGLFAGDYIEMLCVQDSGVPIGIDPISTWLHLEFGV